MKRLVARIRDAVIAIQLVAVGRIVAERVPDPYAWSAGAVVGWLGGFGPWVGLPALGFGCSVSPRLWAPMRSDESTPAITPLQLGYVTPMFALALRDPIQNGETHVER